MNSSEKRLMRVCPGGWPTGHIGQGEEGIVIKEIRIVPPFTDPHLGRFVAILHQRWPRTDSEGHRPSLGTSPSDTNPLLNPPPSIISDGSTPADLAQFRYSPIKRNGGSLSLRIIKINFFAAFIIFELQIILL